MALSAQAIQEVLKEKKELRPRFIQELYLANKNLQEVIDLSSFRNLTDLWLNNNKLRKINCLSKNCTIARLHLNNNELVTLEGALSQLSNLQVLMLHNNQLTNLEKVVKELKNMQALRILNLFNNPVMQETDYRHYVIYHLPSVEILDRQEVLSSERHEAFKIYGQEGYQIEESVAFGRRTEGPPYIFYPGDGIPKPVTIPESVDVGNNYYRDNPPYESDEQAAMMRNLKRSIKEFSIFDWSKVPRAQERRVLDKPFTDPKLITKVYR